jgi:hypothetical protein
MHQLNPELKTMDERNEGVVSHYLTEFQSAAFRSESGEDVTELILILVENAKKHLDTWSSAAPTHNRRKLTAQLRKRAELGAQSSPTVAKVLLDAAEQLTR